jgi:hypothetical protein
MRVDGNGQYGQDGRQLLFCRYAPATTTYLVANQWKGGLAGKTNCQGAFLQAPLPEFNVERQQPKSIPKEELR